MNAWLDHLLQASDSMFPTGAYAHSFGLEGLVADGSVADEASLRDYLEHSFLPAIAASDLPLVQAAWRAASAGRVDSLLELDDLAGALRPTRELREASKRTGSQRLATLVQLSANPLLKEFQQKGGEGHAPVVFGLECAVWAVPVEAALQSYAYQALSGQIAAGVKLISMGQMAAQRLLHDLLAELDFHVDVATATPPENAGWFTPLTDIASAQHERANMRLFIS